MSGIVLYHCPSGFWNRVSLLEPSFGHFAGLAGSKLQGCSCIHTSVAVPVFLSCLAFTRGMGIWACLHTCAGSSLPTELAPSPHFQHLSKIHNTAQKKSSILPDIVQCYFCIPHSCVTSLFQGSHKSTVSVDAIFISSTKDTAVYPFSHGKPLHFNSDPFSLLRHPLPNFASKICLPVCFHPRCCNPNPRHDLWLGL